MCSNILNRGVIGIGNLFKGYVFFKLISTGIAFIAVGIIGFVFTFLSGDPSILLIALPFLLIGIGALFVCLKIYRSDRDTSSKGKRTDIGYSKGVNKHVYPDCGEKEMDVSFDGSGVCDNCGYATRDYHSER